MKLYFGFSQLPELADLTRGQKKAVIQCALEALYAEQPSAVWIGLPWILGNILIGALAGWIVAVTAGLAYFKLTIAAGALAGAMLGLFIAGQFHAAQVRPYLRRVIEERREEIARVK